MTTKEKLDAMGLRLAHHYEKEYYVEIPGGGGMAYKAGFSALKEHTLALAAVLEWYNSPGQPEDEGTPGSVYHKSGLHLPAQKALAKFEAFLEGK